MKDYISRIRKDYKNYKKYRSLKSILDRNAALKNTAGSEVCFVIGNGPSLKKHDLTALSGCKIVLNSFYLHPDLKKINPDYYIFADPEGQNTEKDNVLKWWNEIANYTSGLATTFVLPVSLRKTNVASELLKDREKYYVFFRRMMSVETVRNFDITKPIPYCQNTVAEGLLLAMYMGYRNIVVLGTDHDWLSHWNVDTHFYSGAAQPAIGSDIKMPYYWWLNAVNTMFQQYLAIKTVADERGIRIVNCSEAGVLDVFPMKPLNVCLQELKHS